MVGYLEMVHVLGWPQLQPVMLSEPPSTQNCCDRGVHGWAVTTTALKAPCAIFMAKEGPSPSPSPK